MSTFHLIAHKMIVIEIHSFSTKYILQISKIGLFYMNFKCRTFLLDSTCASRLDCNQHNTNVLILFFPIHCPVDNIDCVDNKCLCTIDKVRFRCLQLQSLKKSDKRHLIQNKTKSDRLVTNILETWKCYIHLHVTYEVNITFDLFLHWTKLDLELL